MKSLNFGGKGPNLNKVGFVLNKVGKNLKRWTFFTEADNLPLKLPRFDPRPAKPRPCQM